MLGRWHGMNGQGFAISEATDAKAMFQWYAQWADLMELSVTPCVEDADAGPVLASLPCCRHCSDHRKSQAGRNSASHHRTRNNLGLDRLPRAPVVARHARNRSFLGVSWKAVIRWLMTSRQEAVAVPAWRRPVMSRRSRRDDRQQR